MQLSKCVGRLIGVTTLVALCATLSFTSSGNAADAKDKIDYLKAKPLQDNLKSVQLQPVKGGKWKIPTITWPGDVATVFTEQDGIFKAEGLDVELFCQNDFAQQVQDVIDGKTPFLRGTYGMINSAAESFQKAGTELVVVYVMTRSTGGDCMVVAPGVKNLMDLKGKTGVLQLYGPHMDFVPTILSRAGLKPSDVNLKWVKELSIPAKDTGRIVDPRSAFAAKAGIDFCMVISPDAAVLTSNGAADGGKGSDDSVKGAKTLFSSKSADHIIFDVYAVRKDWYDTHKDEVEKFVHALMTGTEKFQALVDDKANNQAKYKSLLKTSTKLLYDGAEDAGTIKSNEDSLGDCKWVGFQGNVEFFTGQGTTRNFAVLTNEIQTYFLDLGLMTKRVDINKAGWDYTKLAKGLKNVDLAAVPKPAFDTTKTQQRVANQIKTELDAYTADSLYTFEVYFEANRIDFSAAEYQDAFKKLLEIQQTFGGALLIVEGHNSPDLINKMKKDGQSPTAISQVEQVANNVSYRRAEAVQKAYMEFCTKQKIKVDESQFALVGLGVRTPKVADPTTADERKKCRRVVFRVKAVETESDN